MKTLLIPVIVAALSLASTVSFASDAEAAQKVAVVKNVSPKYPASAHRKGTVGYVLLEYSVDERGRAQDVVVVESMPQSTFDRSSIRALKASRFEKTQVSGEPISVSGQRKFYVFDIDQLGESVAKRK